MYADLPSAHAPMASRQAASLIRRLTHRDHAALGECYDLYAGLVNGLAGLIPRDRAKKVLDSLSPDQRKALELAYYDGLTQSEIAERLGEPLGTIKTRIRTAMIRLRGMLGPSS